MHPGGQESAENVVVITPDAGHQRKFIEVVIGVLEEDPGNRFGSQVILSRQGFVVATPITNTTNNKVIFLMLICLNGFTMK